MTICYTTFRGQGPNSNFADASLYLWRLRGLSLSAELYRWECLHRDTSYLQREAVEGATDETLAGC